MIDLHAHTRASDGQYPADELVLRAREAGITVLGVTDHDTVAGLPSALEAGERAGVRVVPGIELSSFVHGREAHILGHFIDPGDERLRGLSRLLRTQREERMARMVEKVRELGMQATFEEVVAESGGKNLGRPHLARVLVKHGYVRDVKEAFARYIARDKPAYVERYKLTSQEAIEMIGRAGGCATLAHAFASNLSREDIVLLKEQGLVGLEVVHPDHSPDDRAEAGRLAAELDLVPTAGSDFHGELIVPERRLGMATMEERDLERLEARARAVRVG
ncbi:MAG: PHP domain-containing protein [Myxococcales bacterium]|jgi:predicted metal-dependent phosphoesterase TrpH